MIRRPSSTRAAIGIQGARGEAAELAAAPLCLAVSGESLALEDIIVAGLDARELSVGEISRVGSRFSRCEDLASLPFVAGQLIPSSVIGFCFQILLPGDEVGD